MRPSPAALATLSDSRTPRNPRTPRRRSWWRTVVFRR